MRVLAEATDNWELIIVDDGSTDHTGQVAARLADRFEGRVIVAAHRVNQGYGAALQTGIQSGLETGLEAIGFMDADDQFSAEDVPRFLDCMTDTGADLVVGYRQVRADNLRRRLMGRCWHHLSRLLLGFSIRDVDCGFKLFKTDALKIMAPLLTSRSATISPEIMAQACRHHLQVAEVPVHHRPRRHGRQSGANPAVIWKSLASLLRLSYRLRREA